jgi:hypothetical protein
MNTFQLSLLIQRELEDGRNPLELEKLIRAANDQATEKGAIDRRVLKKLAREPERVRLGYRQLVALNNYFHWVGLPGLDEQPILLKPGVLDCLVEKPRLAFLLGSTPRPHEQRNDISRWDTRSMADLLHAVCLRSTLRPVRRANLSFELKDVLLDFSARPETFAGQDWYGLLQDNQTSVLSIGSPRASHASEILLARLFHQKPFEAPAAGDAALPFYFIWPDLKQGAPRPALRGAGRRLRENPPGFRSRFALAADDIVKRDKALARAIRAGKACAFSLGSKLYPVHIGPKHFKMYAVIAAQRRRGGQTHVIIAGISGPATYAAATLLGQIQEPLPGVADQDGPVLYVPIEVGIRVDSARNRSRGDIREVVSKEFLDEPKIWREPPPPEPPRDER